jgi:hypothetical protein
MTSNFGRYADQSASRRKHAGPLGRRRHPADFSVVESDRLLHERVPARRNGEERVLDVEVVRGGDVDDVDVGVVH